jgi:hypothetical protein
VQEALGQLLLLLAHQESTQSLEQSLQLEVVVVLVMMCHLLAAVVLVVVLETCHHLEAPQQIRVIKDQTILPVQATLEVEEVELAKLAELMVLVLVEMVLAHP